MTEPAGRGAVSRIAVWDLPVRLFHWVLVICLAGSWWTAENDDWESHLLFGYTILGLVAFRLVWGVMGSDTARFGGFVRGPRAALGHVRELLRPGPLQAHAGHNPLGGWAVLLLLALLTVQVSTGLFLSGGDIFLVEAPLYGAVSPGTTRLLEEVHEVTFEILLWVAGLHVVAVLAYWVVKGRNLIGPMLSGRALLPAGEPPPRLAGIGRALAAAVLVAAGVWALVTYA